MIVRLILLVTIAVLMTGCPTPGKYLLPVDSKLSPWEQTEMVEEMPEPAKPEPVTAAPPAAATDAPAAKAPAAKGPKKAK